MAQNIIYSDIYWDWVKDGQGNLKIVINEFAVQTSLTNILMTNKKERVMRPTFGASLNDFLFEIMDQSVADQITSRIKAEITTWDPRIILNGVLYNTDPDNHLVSIDVVFSVLGIDETFTVNIPVAGS